MSAMADAIDWQDSKELSKPHKKVKRGALKQDMRDSRRSGDMSDMQHFMEPLYRHRHTLWSMVLSSVLTSVIWIVLSNK